MRAASGRRALALAGAMVALLVAPATAQAHALLDRSAPADGASLRSAPHQVRLEFTEAVSTRLSSATLLDTRGKPVTGVTVRAGGATGLVVSLPSVPTGAYRLVWRTVSNDDLHATEGSLVFGVGAPASGAVAAPATSEKSASVFESVLRAVDLMTLAVALGSFALLLICIPAAASACRDNLEHAARLTRWVGVAAAGASLLSGAGLVFENGRSAGLSSPAELLDRVVLGTSFGQRYAARELMTFGLVMCVLLARSRHHNAPLFIAAVAAAGIAVAQAGAGHAAGLGSSVAVGAMALHVLAASIWSGGVAMATVLAATALRSDRERRTAVLSAFGRVALPAGVVLVITGLYATGRMTPTTGALLHTAYGHVLLVKVGLAAAVALLGAFHATRLHPELIRRHRNGVRPPRRWSLGAEALCAAAVLGAAALLASTPPATAAAPRSGADAGSVKATGRAGDLVVDVAVSPNRPGQNFMTATVLDSIRPSPAPVTAVRFRLTAPGGRTVVVPARSSGVGLYQAAGDEIDRAGSWKIELLVTRPGLPEARFTAPWSVQPAVLAPPPAVRVTQGPLRTAGGLVAAALAMLVVLGVLLAALAGTRRPAAEAA